MRVQAMTEPGGSTPYLAGEADRADGGGTGTGSFGTWVWVFRRASQSDEAKQYLVRDWSSTFLEAAESNVNRRKVAVESTVTEHSAHVGSELSDTITVSGFPSDHGSFAGNEEYGFGADRLGKRLRTILIHPGGNQRIGDMRASYSGVPAFLDLGEHGLP